MDAGWPPEMPVFAIYTCLDHMIQRFKHISVLSVVLLSAVTLNAAKIPTPVYGVVYLASGDSIVADGVTRVGMPVKHKPLAIVDSAYTASVRIARRLVPDSVDSVRVWVPTAPEHTHTLCYFPEYGWCWLLNRGPRISVYFYSPKGYRIAGNGGMWARDKSVMLVVKDGRIFRFKNTHRYVNARFLRDLSAMVADDSALAAEVLSLRGRRDKVLRILSRYNP